MPTFQQALVLLLLLSSPATANKRRLGGCAGDGKKAIECGASKGPGVKSRCCDGYQCSSSGITCVSAGSSNCKITEQTTIAIYVGSGVGSDSKLWAEALIDFWETGMRVPGGSNPLNMGATTWEGDNSLHYVTLDKNDFEDCGDADFAKLGLFFMPGGSAYEIQDALGSNGKAKLTQFLNSGGNYVGICAGGYYVARGYYWKGDDGAPIDNCKNQFCRYEVDGTFSYDTSTQDFTIHEWNGQSYHSNLLAYAPLQNVLVEGPIEEIAGPWHADSNPNHPYDSVLIKTDEETFLRAIYWGGATENYIYTDGSSWGTEHASFAADQTDNDLDFPVPLWSLKSVDSGSGGTIMISSAHFEASLFHKTNFFGDGGMTECQQYNNYVYMVKKMNVMLQSSFAEPVYDPSCVLDRQGETKDTAALFPGGLAYANAPRINSGGGGGGSGGGNPSLIDFDNGSLDPFVVTGGAKNPWQLDVAAACDGTGMGVKAGMPGGVDFVSYLTMTVPEGVTMMTYFYSYPSSLDLGDDFHVIINRSILRSYETGSGVNCATDTVFVNPNGTVQFKCKSGGKGETCAIDQVQFS